MAAARLTLNHAAVGQLLKSARVEGALKSVAERVKANAEQAGVLVQRGSEREPMPYSVLSSPSSTRARVYVVAAHPAGIAAEAKYGTLSKALDGA